MPGEIDQRALAHHRRRRDDFSEQQTGERQRADNELRPDKAHHRFARYAERERDAGLRGDDPEADLADLPRNGCIIMRLEIAGDDRTENRLKAALQLLRQ